MANEIPTTTTPEVAAPPPAPVAAPVSNQDLSLADHIADHMKMVQDKVREAASSGKGKAPEKAVPVIPDAPDAPVVAAKAEPEKPAEATPAADATSPAAKEDPKPAEDKPAEDERAKLLAEYVRGKRQLKAERAAFEAEKAQAKAEREAIAAEKAKIAAFSEKRTKDPVDAVRELLGDDVFNGGFLLDALERTADVELTDEQKAEAIEKSATAKALAALKAEQEEAATKSNAELEQRREHAKATFLGNVNTFLDANADKYPNMAAEGWDRNEVLEAVSEHRKATGVWPTPAQVLTHFENMHVERARAYATRNKLGGNHVATAPAPVAPEKSPAAAPVRAPADTRGAQSKPAKFGTFEQQRDEIAARLDGRVAG